MNRAHHKPWTEPHFSGSCPSLMFTSEKKKNLVPPSPPEKITLGRNFLLYMLFFCVQVFLMGRVGCKSCGGVNRMCVHLWPEHVYEYMRLNAYALEPCLGERNTPNSLNVSQCLCVPVKLSIEGIGIWGNGIEDSHPFLYFRSINPPTFLQALENEFHKLWKSIFEVRQVCNCCRA